MDILAPDEANFDHLIQVDKNIQPHIKNMNRILSNSIEILVLDSLICAIDIHSQLSHTPSDNLPTLIDNIVSIKSSKLNPNKNPFVLSFFLNEEAQFIIETKYNYSEFQNLLLTKFMKKLPTYQGFHNTFAFAELFKMESFILPENKSIYNQLSEEHLEHFFFKAFKNDMVYSVFDKNEAFFNHFSIDIVKYLQSNNSNPLIEKFIERCVGIDPFNNTEFPTLFPEEINIIRKLKTQHDFLVLNSKIPEKNIKSKPNKI